MNESIFPCMTLFLCPGPRFKLLPRIRLPKCALPALTQFLSPDHCNLHFHWVNKPENLCDAFWLLPCHHPEEQKFSFLVPSWILKSMPRTWKRKTDRGVPLNVLEKASTDVKVQGKSVRLVAKLYGICHVTLYRFYKPRKKLEDQGSNKRPCVGYSSEKKVFTLEQEKFGSCKCILWTANKGAINFCKTNGIVLQQPTKLLLQWPAKLLLQLPAKLLLQRPAKLLLQQPAKLLLQQPANPLQKKHSLTSPLSQYWSDPYQARNEKTHRNKTVRATAPCWRSDASETLWSLGPRNNHTLYLKTLKINESQTVSNF
ncbi:hypothetical protein ATANTOWER_002405 [Ataeniobius toweri]|uniref:HTH psq-type domain-containing protein n=1 Tax=Ataeniobius toweri TaxID=208326 RepID=A0ABU7B6W6_9TELE|nr:hypothetical protein [Ataeniobius toweri]